MENLNSMSQWDPLNLVALVWAKQLLSKSGITDPPSSRLWETLCADDALTRSALSRHRLIPAAAAWVADHPEPLVSIAIQKWLITEQTRVRRQTLALIAAANQIQLALAGSDIKTLFVKGPFQAKRATGDPAGRETGDLDVLVNPKDFDRALRTLVSEGATLTGKQVDARIARRISQVHHATALQVAGFDVDLHQRLDPNPRRMHTRFRHLWMQRDVVQIAGIDFATLSPIDACLLVASHGSRDSWLQIRQIVDFAQLIARLRAGGTDLDPLQERARQYGVSGRLAVALAVARLLVPEIPPQPKPAERLAAWTRNRYRKGGLSVYSRTPRQAASVFIFSMLSENSASDMGFSLRRLIWSTSTNVEPLFANQATWAYPMLAPVNVVRRMIRLNKPDLKHEPGDPKGVSPVSHQQLLFMIAIESHPLGALDAWLQWRAKIPNLDTITSLEMSLLPLAWRVFRDAGGSDPDSGRIEGVLRKVSVQASAVVSESSRVQQSLTKRGIRSELTGAVAAALAHPHLARWPLLSANIWISDADQKEAIAPDKPRRYNQLLGRHPVAGTSSPVVLTWRSVNRLLRKSHFRETSVIEWQSRQLHVTPPHVTAMDVLVETMSKSVPGEGMSLLALVDLQLLSKDSAFDREQFIYLRRHGGWNGLFAAHARACRGFLSQDLFDLLCDSVDTTATYGKSPVKWGQDLAARILPRAIRLVLRIPS